MLTARLKVRNPSGLHARPAATLVKAAAVFRSQITIENLTRRSAPANAKSLLAVLGCGISLGHRIRIVVDGEDEAAALESLASLARGGFGEPVDR
jgi:phosphotransferase system HPr (HPr) family protein